jgi:4-amino-4-deoxy-L-arabinose transferase-like glycosyltransferase
MNDPTPLSPIDPVDFLLGVLTLLVAVAFLSVLGVEASGAHFFADECFHAAAARWIAEHAALPVRLPEFYSGYAYSYPPLFHLLGAALIRVSGLGALPWLNLGVAALTFLVLALGPPAGTSHAARRWAILACAANASFATYTLRFYSEALVGLWTTIAFVLLLRLRASGSVRAALGLGLAVGLANATKLSAVALLLLPLAAAALWALRGEGRLAGRALLASAIGVAVAMPVWLRNQARFGSAFYPLGAPDLDRDLYRLHLERFSLPAGEFFARVSAAFGPIVIALALTGLVLALDRRRHDVTSSFLAFGVALVLVAPLLPVHDVRHVLPLLPSLALAGSLGARHARARASGALCRGGARDRRGGAIARLAGLRARLDPPAELRSAYRAITTEMPAYRTVLSFSDLRHRVSLGAARDRPIPWDRHRIRSRCSRPAIRTSSSALDRHRIVDAVLLPFHTRRSGSMARTIRARS